MCSATTSENYKTYGEAVRGARHGRPRRHCININEFKTMYIRHVLTLLVVISVLTVRAYGGTRGILFIIR